MAGSDSSLFGDLKSIAVKAIREQLMLKLVEQWPRLFALAGWVINPILTGVLDMILMFLLNKTILGVSLAWVAIDLSYKVKSAEDATLRLKDILDHPEKYTNAELKEVEDNFDSQAEALIRIGITQLP